MSFLQDKMARVSVECGDLFRTNADILLLKYADGFHGADLRAARILGLSDGIPLRSGEHRTFNGGGEIAAPVVCFIGVGPLRGFRYQEIREFGRNALMIAETVQPGARRLALTVHGPGYGLDEREAVFALFAGFCETDRPTTRPGSSSPSSITIVERDKRRCERIRGYLEEFKKSFTKHPTEEATPFGTSKSAAGQQIVYDGPISLDFGAASEDKPHVFVAMPFAKEYTDEWELGVREPVNALGFLCERMDAEIYTGGVLQQIKSRIESCNVLLAVLTGDNPNVYLEVGYAWGKGKPTVLAVRDGHKVRFDVQGERYLTYESVFDLRNKVRAELEGLKRRRLI